MKKISDRMYEIGRGISGGDVARIMTCVFIVLILFSILMACGSGSGGGGTPGDPPPIDDPPALNTNTVGFSCLSVDNDQTCSGTEDAPGIWNSGAVAITGVPLPQDYINVEITNEQDIAVSVFAYSMITIIGCGDNPVAFDVVDLAPGESAEFSYLTQNYRCGDLGDQSLIVSLFNASGFNPEDYANPWTYPRTAFISNGTVQWDNRLIGDMPQGKAGGM